MLSDSTSEPGTKRPGRVRLAAACSLLVTMLMIAERISSAHLGRSVEGILQVSRGLIFVMKIDYRHKSKTLTIATFDRLYSFQTNPSGRVVLQSDVGSATLYSQCWFVFTEEREQHTSARETPVES